MIPPFTRNWSANEVRAGRGYRVEVKGEVEVSATNLVPKLRMHAPQGTRVLLLDLNIEEDGALGGPAVMLKEAAFTRSSSGHAYDEAEILFQGEIIERIAVGHPKAAAKPPGKKAARKPARKAKKAAARKKAAKKIKKAKTKKAAKRKKRF
jgi:hypothetical protein